MSLLVVGISIRDSLPTQPAVVNALDVTSQHRLLCERIAAVFALEAAHAAVGFDVLPQVVIRRVYGETSVERAPERRCVAGLMLLLRKESQRRHVIQSSVWPDTVVDFCSIEYRQSTAIGDVSFFASSNATGFTYRFESIKSLGDAVVAFLVSSLARIVFTRI